MLLISDGRYGSVKVSTGILRYDKRAKPGNFSNCPIKIKR